MKEKFTLEEIAKAIHVSNKVLDEVQKLLKSGLNPCYKDVEEFFMELSAEIYAHWQEEQATLNAFVIKSDARFEILSKELLNKYEKNYLDLAV